MPAATISPAAPPSQNDDQGSESADRPAATAHAATTSTNIENTSPG